MASDKEQIRELFIEELEQVTGGSGGGIKETLERIGDLFQTTMACGEEGPPC